jgi:monovalent cation:H+ antiporter, CPA1 family
MDTFHVIALLLTLTALFSYLNDRYIHLHPSVGVMLIALLLSLALIAAGHFGLSIRPLAVAFMQNVKFDTALLHWMLGFLLFGGALTVDVSELIRHRTVVFLLSTLGTTLSMFIVAIVVYPLMHLLGIALPWLDCLLFGALISPTDPVAVVGFLKTVNAPKSVETIVAAESLFNDGVGVVLFLTFLSLAHGGATFSTTTMIRLLIQEALGGALLGLLTGLFVHNFLRKIRNFQLESLLTLALVMETYSLADRFNFSGPIAAVSAGLLIGNRSPTFALSKETLTNLHRLWGLIEEILNAVLFVLVGLEMLVIPFNHQRLAAALLCIPLVLLARWLSVHCSVTLIPRRKEMNPALYPILIWGGLRGGLALAMALLIPPGTEHDRIVAITYAVVAFSILIQGTTLSRLVKRVTPLSV